MFPRSFFNFVDATKKMFYVLILKTFQKTWLAVSSDNSCFILVFNYAETLFKLFCISDFTPDLLLYSTNRLYHT